MTNVRTDARGFAVGIKSADEARTQELVNAFNHACEGHLNGEILFALAAVAGANARGDDPLPPKWQHPCPSFHVEH